MLFCIRAFYSLVVYAYESDGKTVKKKKKKKTTTKNTRVITISQLKKEREKKLQQLCETNGNVMITMQDPNPNKGG